jgi:hypothetical protein
MMRICFSHLLVISNFSRFGTIARFREWHSNENYYKSYTVNSRRVMIRDDNGRTGWDSGGSELRFVAPVTSDYIIRVFPSGVSPDSRYSASEQSASGSGTTGDYELDIRWYPELDEQINPEME